MWPTGPSRERWEVYTVLADTEHFGAAPVFAEMSDGEAVQACCGTDGDSTGKENDAGRRPEVACCTPTLAAE